MIAHMRKTDYEIQGVQEHLDSVAEIAKEYGKKAGFSSSAELAGLLHDMGKNTSAFSTYIENAVKETGEPLERIDHSTAGAKYLYETYYVENQNKQEEAMSKFTVEIIGMVILSHHSGLQNFVQTDGRQSDFFRRVCNKELPYYEEVRTTFLSVPGNAARVNDLFELAKEEVKTFSLKIQALLGNYDKGKASPFLFFSLAMKYIFSCLIDADRTDSRRFDEEDETELHQSNKAFFEKSYSHLMDQVREWEESPSAEKPINQLRREMSEQCDKIAEEPSNIYKLSIPTGGGKTYASLRYALKHANLTGKERIIYVVPFTTILEQNADAVREIIQSEEQVLEHHANVIDDVKDEDEPDFYRYPYQKRMQLARDNWDHPIIFTTMVQFLDTFYARGTRKSRRLHNLTNAVVIFDEVQSVPVKHIPLFNSAVNFLHHIGKSSIILCTATQPSLAKTTYPLMMDDKEMVQDLPNVVKAFERVTIESKVEREGWDAGEISDFTLDTLENKQSILIILNTKNAVLNVYQQLKERPGIQVYHLSTSMCPQHRKDQLKIIKEKLELGEEKIVCISTQLIEAGVDISFESVIRSLAGIDSIAQAAGRCNRHAETNKGMVYIIRAKDEALSRLKEIKLGQEVTEEDVLSRAELVEDLLSPKAIQTYFNYYLAKAQNEIPMTNSKLNVELVELINHCAKYVAAMPKNEPKTLMTTMYQTLENHFEVIEAPTTAILVPYGDRGKELIQYFNEDIRDYDELNEKLKEAQQFSVNVYRHTLQALAEEELLVSLYNDSIYALRDGGYHKEYGLEIDGEGSLEDLVF